MNLNKKITITDDCYSTTDEIYCTFYKCKKCDSTDLQENFNYCPECGSELEWKLKPRKINRWNS